MNLKIPPISVMLAVFFGIALFFIFMFIVPGAKWFFKPESGSGYAILIFDEEEDDRSIQERLTQDGQDDFISESSQFVPVDDFGALKLIPLDFYKSEIEEFDPRDDGYAAKMSSFFVQNGKRFFFKSLDGDSGNTAEKVKKQVTTILKDVPFSLVVFEQKGGSLLYFAFIAAGFTLAFFLSGSRALFAFQLPVFLSIGHFGHSSVILAAILAGIWELLREPLKEITASLSYKRRSFDYAGAGFKGIVERLKPFRLNLFLLLIFLVFFVSFSIVISPILLVVVFVSFSFFYLLSFLAEAEKAKRNSHVVFNPVLLFSRRAKTFSFIRILIPFGVMAFIVLFLPRAIPEGNPDLFDNRLFISSEEYDRHIAFQRTFSYMPMNQNDSGALQQTEYLRYYLGEDGLIAGNFPYYEPEKEENPPFPLEKLMDFLIDYNKIVLGESLNNKETKLTHMDDVLKDWMRVAFVFSVCLLDFLRPGIVMKTKKKAPVVGEKRIAA